MASAGEIRFHGWTLRPSTGELLRDGATVRLQVQPLLVLEELLSNPGEVVTREQLITRLWPRGIVDFDTALNSAVRRLRTALGDHADTPRYIETLPKRGYRFIGTLEPVAPAVPAAPASIEPVGTTPTEAAGPNPPPDAVQTSRASRSQGSLRWAAAAVVLICAIALGNWSLNRTQEKSAAHAPEVSAAVVPAAAHERLQQARFLLQRRGDGDVARAREHFEAALRLHPTYARAWSGVASTWFIDAVEGREARDPALERMRDAALRALRVDPGVAEAHVRLANYDFLHGDRAGGKVHLDRAMAAQPDDPLVLALAASHAFERGASDEALALQRRAVEADPLALAPRRNLAVLLYVTGRYDDARAELHELREIDTGPDTSSDLLLAQSLVLTGDYEAALQQSERMHDGPERLQVQALALHALGRRMESDAALQELQRTARGGRAYLIAEAHAFRGEADHAFAWLDEAASGAEACGSNRCWPPEWLASLPLLKSLHRDARWAPWVAGVSPRAPS